MELLQLKYFCTVARLENISKAAQLHHIPQSAMSKTISKLEVELGASLFQRTPNSLKLNEQGRTFYIQIREALGLIGAATRPFRQDVSIPTSTHVKICIDSCGDYFSPLIINYAKQNGHLLFDISSSRRGNAEGYDFYIGRERDILKGPAYKDWLFLDQVYLAVSERNPLARMERVDLHALRDIQYVMYRDSDLHDKIRGYLQQQDIHWDLLALYDQRHDLYQHVSSDLAISFAPGIYREMLQRRCIKLLPLSGESFPLDIYLYSSQASCEVNPRLEDFRDFIKKNARIG